jgi:hypothetical protein
MNFLLTNEYLESQISQIKRLIRLSMNGVVADSMRNHGLIYKQNFGVAIPRIREIAAGYTKNHDLAQRLWLLNIRETMILATLLQPAEKFTPAHANEWLKKCDNIELIEQMNLNLYRHLNYAPDFSLQCISSGQVMLKTFGYTLAMRIIENLTIVNQQLMIKMAIQDAGNGTSMLSNAIARFLAILCKKNESTARELFNEIQSLNDPASNGKKLIYESVKNELIFLGYMNENL